MAPLAAGLEIAMVLTLEVPHLDVMILVHQLWIALRLVEVVLDHPPHHAVGRDFLNRQCVHVAFLEAAQVPNKSSIC